MENNKGGEARPAQMTLAHACLTRPHVKKEAKKKRTTQKNAGIYNHHCVCRTRSTEEDHGKGKKGPDPPTKGKRHSSDALMRPLRKKRTIDRSGQDLEDRDGESNYKAATGGGRSNKSQLLKVIAFLSRISEQEGGEKGRGGHGSNRSCSRH